MSPSELSPPETVVMLSHALRTPQAGEAAGAKIGLYTLMEKLGDGGFGSVWRAEQSEPVQREVAFKIIKLGMDTLEVMSRFEQERVALSMMDHPNIAKVLDAGATPEGRPFFVMELVRGVPITTYCIEKQVPLEQRLRVFKEVCAGVQHAHQKGIIHRDLKPSNILVAEVDGVPVPKIIDFGIAKAMGGEKLIDQTLRTRAEQMIGTPLYMSPEQADGSADIDTRCDVYALGVLLYELLAGQPPFDAETLMAAGYEEMRRIIREEVPVAPTRRNDECRMSNTEMGTATGVRHSSFGLRHSKDLDLITLRALEKDRARRYESATAFAEDVQRFLNHEPVTARAPSWLYVTQRWVRRHRALALAALAILIGASLAAWQAVRALRSQRETARQLADANAISKVINDTMMEFTDYGKSTTIQRKALADKLITGLRAFDGDPLRKGRMLINLASSVPMSDSVQLLRDGIALIEPHIDPNSHERHLARERLARALCSTEDPTSKEGIALFRECMEWSRADRGVRSSMYFHSLYSVARNVRKLGDLDESLRLFEEVYQLTTTGDVSAFDFGNTCLAHSDYAQALLQAGRKDEALKISRENLARSKPGPEMSSFVVGEVMRGHASLCAKADLLEEAGIAARQAMQLIWEANGPVAKDSKFCFNTLIDIETQRKDNDAIIAAHRDAVRVHDTQLGLMSADTAKAVRVATKVMLDAGRTDEAIKFTDEWLQRVRLTNGTVPPASADILAARIDALVKAGRNDDALPLLQESYEQLLHQSPSERRSEQITEVKSTLEKAAGLSRARELYAKGKYDEAYAAAKENIALIASGRVPKGFTMDGALETLALICEKKKLYQEAHDALARRFELLRDKDHPQHTLSGDAMQTLLHMKMKLERDDGEIRALFNDWVTQWMKETGLTKRNSAPTWATNTFYDMEGMKRWKILDELNGEWLAAMDDSGRSGKVDASAMLYYRCRMETATENWAANEVSARLLLEQRLRYRGVNHYAADAYRFLGRALLRLNRPAEAIPKLQEAIKIFGNDALRGKFIATASALKECQDMLKEATEKR